MVPLVAHDGSVKDNWPPEERYPNGIDFLEVEIISDALRRNKMNRVSLSSLMFIETINLNSFADYFNHGLMRLMYFVL